MSKLQNKLSLLVAAMYLMSANSVATFEKKSIRPCRLDIAALVAAAASPVASPLTGTVIVVPSPATTITAGAELTFTPNRSASCAALIRTVGAESPRPSMFKFQVASTAITVSPSKKRPGAYGDYVGMSAADAVAKAKADADFTMEPVSVAKKARSGAEDASVDGYTSGSSL
jgi:hypothetical protein